MRSNLPLSSRSAAGRTALGGMGHAALRIVSGLLVFFFCYFGEAAVAGTADTAFSGGGIDQGLRDLFVETTDTGIIRSDDIIAVTLGWVRFGLTLLGTVAFVAFIWAGALYVTAFINEGNAENAKKIMIWTAIGIIIILMAYAIVSTLIQATV